MVYPAQAGGMPSHRLMSPIAKTFAVEMCAVVVTHHTQSEERFVASETPHEVAQPRRVLPVVLRETHVNHLEFGRIPGLDIYVVD